MCKINGRRLREFRMEAGMTQKQLAKEIGVSEASIGLYENGKTNPSDENVKRICMILKITEDDVKIQDIGYSFSSGESRTVNNYRKRNGVKRSMTPIELEKWIEERREISDEKAKAIIRNAISKASYKVGNKTYILIDPTLIHVPDWQRDTDMAKVEEIKTNFNENKLDPIKVYVEDGILYVSDGAHRLLAILLRNSELPEDERDMVVVEILECTRQEAVLIFLEQSAGRKSMSVSDMYRAGIKANIEEYIRLRDMCAVHNIQITSDLEKLDNPIGRITPSGTILKLLKGKRNLLDSALNLIEKLDWCGSEKNAYTLRTITTLIKLFSVYGDKVEGKLLKHCKGAVYYESKLFPVKSNAELYDILSEVIGGEMVATTK